MIREKAHTLVVVTSVNLLTWRELYDGVQQFTKEPLNNMWIINQVIKTFANSKSPRHFLKIIYSRVTTHINISHILILNLKLGNIKHC